MKRLTCLVLFPALVFAQLEVEHKSIHQVESELHQNDPARETDQSFVVGSLSPGTNVRASTGKKIFGWHPYWASAGAHLSYDYSMLSHIAYFSYETDAASGSYTTIRSWDTTPIIAYAHQRGVKVMLTVTNFGYDQNDALLSDTIKQNTMINTLISLLRMRGGDGVNFDLESVRSTQRSNLVSFIRRAARGIRSELPGAEISMATPAVDWSGAWDFAQLAQLCDYLIVMGYDYYWKGSTTAGPVAPLEGENHCVSRTVDTYLAAGVPAGRLLLGVPWFGLDWPVQSSARKAAATGTATSRTYTAAEPMALSYGKTFDQATRVPWFSYQSGTTWRQVWYDDSLSLALKYNLVNSRALGGIGIWALGYDGGRAEIWSGMRSAFMSTGIESAEEQSTGEFCLLYNYPNPFNPRTTFEFRVPGRGLVTLAVYDLLGREVALVLHKELDAGSHRALFDTRASGVGVISSGVYVTRLTAGGTTTQKRILLLK